MAESTNLVKEDLQQNTSQVGDSSNGDVATSPAGVHGDPTPQSDESSTSPGEQERQIDQSTSLHENSTDDLTYNATVKLECNSKDSQSEHSSEPDQSSDPVPNNTENSDENADSHGGQKHKTNATEESDFGETSDKKQEGEQQTTGISDEHDTLDSKDNGQNIEMKHQGSEENTQRLTRRVTELESELKSKKDEIEQITKSKNEETESIQQRLATQISKSEELQKDKQNTTLKLERAEAQLNECKLEIEKLQKQYNQKSEDLTKVISQKAYTVEQLQSKEHELQTCKGRWEGQVGHLSKEVTDVKEEKRKLTDIHDRLQKDFQAKEKELTACKRKSDDQAKHLNEQVKDLKQNMRKLTERNEKLDNELTKKEKMILDYQTRMKNDKTQYERNIKDTESRFVKENTKMVKLTDNLKKDSTEIRRQLKQEQDTHRQFTKTYDDLANRVTVYAEQAKSAGHLQLENDQLKRQLDSKNEEIMSLHQDRIALLQEKERLSDCLSKEWSTKVSSDETNTENISVANRPMMIKQEFDSLCSDEWLDAKTELDNCDGVEEDTKRKVLCEIMMSAEKCATEYYEGMMRHLKLYLNQPLTYQVTAMAFDSHGGSKKNDHDEIGTISPEDAQKEVVGKVHVSDKEGKALSFPLELTNALGDFIRCGADAMDISSISKDVASTLTDPKLRYPWIDAVIQSADVQKYISACSLVAWKMISQRPKMAYSQEGLCTKYDEKTQEPNFGSDDPNHKDAVVMYFVTPALYHSHSLMSKGRVVTKIIK